MSSVKLTTAAALQAYAQDYSEDLMSRAFWSEDVGGYAIGHDNVKGKLILTQMVLGTLGRRWSKAFAPRQDTIEFKPRTLSVEAGAFEYEIYPQDFEGTYLAHLKRTKFRDVENIPFEAFIMQKLMMKQAQEIATAMWQGVAAGSPASTDNLSALIDGWLHQIADAITATDLTPTAVPTGAWTLANIIPTFEAMFETIDTDYQSEEMVFHVAPHLYRLFQKAYRDTYKTNTESVSQGVTKLDFVNAYLVAHPAMGVSNRVLLTPTENLHYGFDSLNENDVFQFEQDHRKIDFWSDFKFGVQFGFLEDGIVAVNDLA